MYKREVNKSINRWLNKDEIIVIYGARQTGKTTLTKMLLEQEGSGLIIPCDRPAAAEILESLNPGRIKQLFGDHKIIALDEAQNIENIGRLLKILYDDDEMRYKIIATGSSSFELANKISEPLTGRNIKFSLFPLSINEILSQKSWLWLMENLEQLLIYGTYPGIIDLSGDEKIEKLEELSSDYLFKDILAHENIQNPGVLRKLLKALALQVGQLVSLNELSKLVGVSMPTVEKYLDLLEKTFVIVSLMSYSGNLRNELRKSRKYYFVDNGIRNAIIQNYSNLDNRTDVGELWENFCVIERMKYNHNNRLRRSNYFWRTYDGAEIDLIEIENEKITAMEFKWNPSKRGKLPKSFAEKYNVKTVTTITPENVQELLQ